VNESIAAMLVLITAVYAVIGCVFALAFLVIGAKRVDGAVPGSTRGFAVFVFPGVALLWPVMAMKWMRLKKVAA